MRQKMGVFVVLLSCAIVVNCAFAAAPKASVPERAPGESNSAKMDFSRAVGLLLEHSPFVRNSSLEIQVRRIDESDARYSFVPGVTFRTRYYVNTPAGPNVGDPYSIEFGIDPYNPLETYATLQARKAIVHISILAHLQVISDALQRLGIGFLELESLDRFARLNDLLIDLGEHAVAYYRSRATTGGATLLEVRTVEQELEAGLAERERIAASRATIVDGMKSLIGLQADQVPDLDLREAKQEIIGRFNHSAASLEEARNNSMDLQIQKLKVELQKKNVTVAYTKFLPNLLFGLQTTDPLGATVDRGLFFSVGIELPIWDGLKRYHNITRQKTMLHQTNAETEIKELDFENKWQAARNKLKETAAQLKLAKSQEELAGLREKQVEIGYKAGREPLATLLAEQRRLLDAKRNLLLRTIEHDKSVLALRTLSGDLLNTYVKAKSYEN